MKTLTYLSEHAESESVRFQSSRDLLDRAGHRPIDRREEIRQKRTPEELEAEMVRLVGAETADLLLGKKTVDDLVKEREEKKDQKQLIW